MRNLLFAMLICIILGSCSSLPTFNAISDFDNRYQEGVDGQTIIFIGKKIGVDRSPPEQWCPEDAICLDQKLHARYRIIELLEGDFDETVIDFAVFDHGVLNPFWNHDIVVLYIAQIGERLFHHKYQYDALSPLRGGGFAYCGDPYNDYDQAQIDAFGRKPLTRYFFSPSIRKQLSEFLPEQDKFQDKVRERFIDGMRTIAPPAFKIENGVATCRMGVSAEELAEIRMQYQYSEGAKNWLNSQ